MNLVRVLIIGDSGPADDVEIGTGRGMQFICNGWVLSAMAGWGNYCSSDPLRNPGLVLTRQTQRDDCEIALWQFPGGRLISLGNDEVLGWVPWGKVIEIVSWFMGSDHEPTKSEVQEFVLRVCKQ